MNIYCDNIENVDVDIHYISTLKAYKFEIFGNENKSKYLVFGVSSCHII